MGLKTTIASAVVGGAVTLGSVGLYSTAQIAKMEAYVEDYVDCMGGHLTINGRISGSDMMHIYDHHTSSGSTENLYSSIINCDPDGDYTNMQLLYWSTPASPPIIIDGITISPSSDFKEGYFIKGLNISYNHGEKLINELNYNKFFIDGEEDIIEE